MPIEELYALYLQHPAVETDTRKLRPGTIFFALKGGNFNGNTFARQAIDAGAVAAVIDDPAYVIDGKTVLVNDVLTTLQELARHHRSQFKIPFIAITGSNGKTTTKELIHAVLSAHYRTYTTEGNLNNHIGIPLTLLKVRSDAEMAVIEMGANHQREIAGYCRYALPTHGLITNVGKAHLEGFGGEEGVRKGKGELFDYLRTIADGTVFVNWDYDYLHDMSKGINTIVKYGTQAGVQVQGNILQSDPFLVVNMETEFSIKKIPTQLVGAYNLPNVLAAVAVGKHFNVPEKTIVSALGQYTPSNSRSQLLRKDTNTIILDAYNANPSSMKLAIENFARLQASDKVLLLGAMAELGAGSIDEHKAIVDLIAQYQWKDVALVGGDFLRFEHPYHRFANVAEARSWWQAQQFTHTSFLIKGSRSMQMEKILEP
ncbi:MAG: UDP-N-acetylmuramoyl-tripeptide--D-alanyl-D-alanine ligase [Chitinophagaceae bacterium]|nr:UDP-N-acetylmuramoyl-tripeptide--D-alanyl-D-alanine ligase [Chitinophagaceae bacterium]